MKITKMAVYLSVFFASVLSAAHFPADNSWLNNVRPEHPRMIFTKDNLPLVREQIKTIRKKEFENLQSIVQSLLDDYVSKKDLQNLEQQITMTQWSSLEGE